MRFLTAAAALALTATAPLASAAEVKGFTVDNVKSLIAEGGGSNIAAHTVEGTQMVTFEMGGLPFAYTLQLCDTKGSGACAGLLMAIGMEVDKPYSLEALNAFNRDIAAVTVVQLDAKTIAFGRFVIAVGGINSENFKANMQFVGVAPELFVRHQASQVVASTDKGQATTVSAPTTPATAPKAVPLSAKAIGRMIDQELLGKLGQK